MAVGSKNRAVIGNLASPQSSRVRLDEHAIETHIAYCNTAFQLRLTCSMPVRDRTLLVRRTERIPTEKHPIQFLTLCLGPETRNPAFRAAWQKGSLMKSTLAEPALLQKALPAKGISRCQVGSRSRMGRPGVRREARQPTSGGICRLNARRERHVPPGSRQLKVADRHATWERTYVEWTHAEHASTFLGTLQTIRD